MVGTKRPQANGHDNATFPCGDKCKAFNATFNPIDFFFDGTKFVYYKLADHTKMDGSNHSNSCSRKNNSIKDISKYTLKIFNSSKNDVIEDSKALDDVFMMDSRFGIPLIEY